MSEILGPNGRPWRTEHVAGKSQPVKGEAFGPWAGRDLQYVDLPGGGMVQFDLSRLTLADFRMMTSHYQVNSSLSVLMFMLHQLDWHIECDDPKVAAHVEDNMHSIWSRLVRAMSQAFWAGYSPSILQWENDTQSGTVQLTKVKDLAPEEATVNWKEVAVALPPGSAPGAVPRKARIFDGIKQVGVAGPIPTTNSFWYPLLMENGNYAGRKLLKSAFQPWFFSTLMHLFSNRYFERFGEPVPVGRAPLNDNVKVGDKDVTGVDYMGMMLQQIRSRAAVVLPSDRSPGSETGSLKDNYDYDIQYLESQMRGADFERYMTRLDEEISLALFTPLLLMRTADVGSYNLGVSHMQMYLWQLNAISGDWAEYINNYILAQMARFNFGPRAALPKIVFHKMGKTQAETNRTIIQALIQNGLVGVDLVELGQSIGLELHEIEQLNENEDDDAGNGNDTPAEDAGSGLGDDETGTDASSPVKGSRFTATSTVPGTPVIDKVIARVAGQAARAHARGTLGGGWTPDIGFTSHYDAHKINALKMWHEESAGDYNSDDAYMSAFAEAATGILEG